MALFASVRYSHMHAIVDGTSWTGVLMQFGSLGQLCSSHIIIVLCVCLSVETLNAFDKLLYPYASSESTEGTTHPMYSTTEHVCVLPVGVQFRDFSPSAVGLAPCTPGSAINLPIMASVPVYSCGFTPRQIAVMLRLDASI